MASAHDTFFASSTTVNLIKVPDSIFVSATEVESTSPAVINLSKHFRCSSHSLYLLGKNDVNKAIDSFVDKVPR